MLTQQTQQAIAVLHDIATQSTHAVEKYRIAPEELAMILARLEYKGLIQRTAGADIQDVARYKLCRPLEQMSLLDVIEAMKDHLNCNQPTSEEFYIKYGRVAQKLGVVNHMTRLYLSEIKLTDC